MDKHERRDAAEATAIIGDFEREFYEDVLGQTEDGDDDGRKMQDLQLLQEAWVRERAVGAVLPHEDALVGRVVGRVRAQLAFLEEHAVALGGGGGGGDRDVKLHLVVVEGELERAQFLVRAYLRTRLRKLDRHAQAMRAHPAAWAALLTPDEHMYVQGRLAMVHTVLAGATGGDGRDNLGAGAEADADEVPTDGHVFVRTVRPVVVAGERLQPGEVHVLRWETVREAVLDGSAVVV